MNALFLDFFTAVGLASICWMAGSMHEMRQQIKRKLFDLEKISGRQK